MAMPQLPRHQYQQEIDSDEMFISIPESSAPQYASAKLCTPQQPGLYAPQPGTPPQLVPDAAAWPSPQPCPQAWPAHQQGLQEGAVGLEEAALDFTPWLEDFQGLQVCQGEPELLHESQCVSQVLHSVPQGLQKSQGIPYFQQVCQDVPEVPQGPHRAPQVGQGEQESQQSPASQEGSPMGTEGAAGPRRARRAPRPRQSKLYERKEPFEDPLQEKRRRDAINSKKNRDASKAKMTDLRRRLNSAATLRDNLRREVAALRQRETQLLAQLGGQAPAAAPVTTLTAPHGQGRPLAATLPPAATLAGTPQGTAFLPATTATTTATLPPAATLAGTPQGTAFLPATTTTASLPCPSPHLTLATPYLPPTPPSTFMQADTPLFTPTSSPSPCPYFDPFTPPTPHPPH